MHDSGKGSAWPLLVGEVICLLNCVNERDLCQLLDTSFALGHCWAGGGTWGQLCGLLLALLVAENAGFKNSFLLLIGIMQTNCIETRAQSRSVMLLNVLGCTRTTLIQPTSFCTSTSWGETWEDFVSTACPEGVGESFEPES